MGLPRVWGRVGGVVIEGGTVGGPELRRKEDGGGSMRKGDEGEGGKGTRLGIAWTVGYYIVLIGGAFAWWKCLWWLTECKGALMRFGL